MDNLHLKSHQADEFGSPDLALAAFLCSRGKTLKRIDVKGKQGVFVFDQKFLDDDVEKYRQGDTKVEPMLYMLALKKLKAKLGDVLNTGGAV